MVNPKSLKNKIEMDITNFKISVFLVGLITLTCCSCADQSTQLIDKEYDIHILPKPKSIEITRDAIKLSPQSKSYTQDKEIGPLLNLLSKEIKSTTGLTVDQTEKNNDFADIIFTKDESLESGEYEIVINKSILVSGGSYTALANAKTTLLQLVIRDGEDLIFPRLTIRDHADAEFRALMIDLARNWHDLATVKKLIDLAAFYKINYVQLHFTDYQLYTLPSRHYPKLSTPNKHYSFTQLEELEAYSQLRGVTIIPELEVPGHAGQFVKMHPEIFAIQDTATNPWIINMGKEEVYQAIDLLVEELTQTFKATPYIHMGGDEAIFKKVIDDPDVQAYITKHGLDNDVHELYRHFLVRMNTIVKKHGKQMCIWEGFGREGKVKIPKDILVFEFETNRYLPNHLVEDGYTVVNTSWKPLYVVNQKKWEPKTIYNWNLWRWENWWIKAPSFAPIQLEETPLVIGAMMCSWEQPQEVEIPSLRKRLPAYAERVWNTKKNVPYEEMMNSMEVTDKILSQLINDNRQDSLLVGYNFKGEE